ncbi:hypothetical protein CHUAL_013043 [Chamberlinius hualienensis]
MFGKFVINVAFFANLIYGLCPDHMELIVNSDGTEFMACEPYLCLCLNENATDVADCDESPLNQILCPDDFEEFQTKFLSTSCHWVKLKRDEDFNFNRGDLYEKKTKLTYPLGDYIYNPKYKEAYICHENLLPNDKTDYIILWCSIVESKVYMSTFEDYSVLDQTIYLNSEYDCMNTSIDFLRSEMKGILNKTEYDFEQLPNGNLLEKGVEGFGDIEYPLGSYYISFDKRFAVIGFGPEVYVEGGSRSNEALSRWIVIFLSLVVYHL